MCAKISADPSRMPRRRASARIRENRGFRRHTSGAVHRTDASAADEATGGARSFAVAACTSERSQWHHRDLVGTAWEADECFAELPTVAGITHRLIERR